LTFTSWKAHAGGAEEEEVGGRARILALGRAHVALLDAPYLLDLHLVDGLHHIVAHLGEVTVVDKHLAEVYGQGQLNVARVLVGLYILQPGDLRLLSALGWNRPRMSLLLSKNE
jgi:hypothetical protein